MLISAPLAVLALGAGFAAQALLRPAVPERDLLDALIAQPGAQAPAAAQASRPDPDAALAARSIRAERAAAPQNDPRSLAEPEAGPSLALEIRVALLKLSAQPRLGASGPWSLSDRSGRVLQSGGAQQAPAVASLLAQEPELLFQTGPGDHLLADGRAYDGRFRLLRGGSGVLVVNHLSLESYISSVVGGEMPSGWNIEALRAQAVAARSYAMAHMARPANAHWHLGDTTRWQNYEGLSSVTGSTREATTSTAGIILSYQGGIVESLYAATQQIVDEAHGHLGASMSQTGAQDLALQGLRYNQILGRYYQGASLARLQAGAR
ncbi:MAG: SpoIID/LytB domain-containing protein [Cyanobium sp.]